MLFLGIGVPAILATALRGVGAAWIGGDTL